MTVIILNTDVKRYYKERYTLIQGVYLGQKLAGMKHGRGLYIYFDGSVYVGQYQYDRPHGEGTFYSSTGSMYRGSYSQGKMHGRGTFTLPGIDGKNIVGDWANDELLHEDQNT